MTQEQIQAMLATSQVDVEEVVGKVKVTPDVEKFANSELAKKAQSGDVEALSALLKDLVGSKEGQDLINQVKDAV